METIVAVVAELKSTIAIVLTAASPVADDPWAKLGAKPKSVACSISMATQQWSFISNIRQKG